jgi:hypothetical protein
MEFSHRRNSINTADSQLNRESETHVRAVEMDIPHGGAGSSLDAPQIRVPRRCAQPTQKTLSDFANGGCLMGEMQDKSDARLLREYAERGCEPAFREIVTRHTDFVYSAALRCVNSPDIACDIAQSVFTDLSRKARPLADKLADTASLVGWLYRSARFAALNHDRLVILANSRLPRRAGPCNVYTLFLCAVSSVVEHYLDTVGVTGSKPVSRTIHPLRFLYRVKHRFNSLNVPP